MTQVGCGEGVEMVGVGVVVATVPTAGTHPGRGRVLGTAYQTA